MGDVKKGSFHQGVSLIVPNRDNIRLSIKLGNCFSLEGFITFFYLYINTLLNFFISFEESSEDTEERKLLIKVPDEFGLGSQKSLGRTNYRKQ